MAKINIKKSNAIIIFFTLLMLVSTFSYSYTQRLSFTQKQPSLPKERILNNISEDERVLAISNGFTIAYLHYTNPFDESKNYLEKIASSYPLYLIEVAENDTYLKVESLKGSREAYNLTLNKTMDLICEIMVYPPRDCVLREIE